MSACAYLPFAQEAEQLQVQVILHILLEVQLLLMCADTLRHGKSNLATYCCDVDPAPKLAGIA